MHTQFALAEHYLTNTASVVLDKALFTTYQFHAPQPQRDSQISDSEDDEDLESTTLPQFQISLPALLETLQIFGLTDPNNSKPPWARDNPYPTSTAFSNNVLGMNNLCRISYDTIGSPLSIILTEASIRTTCDLTTYEPEHTDEIPFDRQSLVLKTVMRGSWLFDAISELTSTSPEKLTMYAKTVRGKPFFAVSSSGTLGSARVEFKNSPQSQSKTHKPFPQRNTDPVAQDTAQPQQQTNLLETFLLSDPAMILRSTYKFSSIQKAQRAMSVATKVSIRIDTQGVLSLQFMVEVDANGMTNASGMGVGETGRKCFVDFRVVPLVEESDDEEDGGEGDVDYTLMQNGQGMSDVDEGAFSDGQ